MIPISIKRKRLEAGLSQEKLALEIGVFQSTVSAWEQGKSTPQPKNLKKIAEACGCSVAEILEEG